jgi:hypothetical protein
MKRGVLKRKTAITTIITRYKEELLELYKGI